MNLQSLVIGVVAAIIAKYLLDYLGVPNPIDWLVALVVFLGVVYGGHRSGTGWGF